MVEENIMYQQTISREKVRCIKAFWAKYRAATPMPHTA